MRPFRLLFFFASFIIDFCFLLSGTAALDQGQPHHDPKSPWPVFPEWHAADYPPREVTITTTKTERTTVTDVSTLHITTTKVIPPSVSTTTKTVDQCSSSPHVSTSPSNLPASTVTKTVTSVTGTCPLSGVTRTVTLSQSASSYSVRSASTVTVTSVQSPTCPSVRSASLPPSTSTCPTAAKSTVTTTSVQTTTLTVTAPATASTSACPTCPQLIQDPSFETGSVSEWIDIGDNLGFSFEIVASSSIPGGAHSGLFAAGYIYNGGPFDYGLPADASLSISAPALCSSSQVYQFHAYVKTVSNSCYVNFYDNASGAVFIDIFLGPGGAAPPWVEMSATITPGATFELTFEVACDTTDSIWVDDITLTPI